MYKRKLKWGAEVAIIEGTIIEKGNSMRELRWLNTKELAYPVQDALDDIAKGRPMKVEYRSGYGGVIVPIFEGMTDELDGLPTKYFSGVRHCTQYPPDIDKTTNDFVFARFYNQTIYDNVDFVAIPKEPYLKSIKNILETKNT